MAGGDHASRWLHCFYGFKYVPRSLLDASPSSAMLACTLLPAGMLRLLSLPVESGHGHASVQANHSDEH